MFKITYKSKSGQMLLATFSRNGAHPVYLSAYGQAVAILLNKYVEDQKADNEELFAEWDKSFEKAKAETGFSAVHEAEGGYVYISTFQSGIGMPEEEAD